MKTLAVITVVALTLVACDARVPASGASGRYSINKDQGEQLVLSPDGTFKHSWNDGTRDHAETGVWEYAAGTECPNLRLAPFSKRASQGRRTYDSVSTCLIGELGGSRVVIAVDTDLGIYFVRE